MIIRYKILFILFVITYALNAQQEALLTEEPTQENSRFPLFINEEKPFNTNLKSEIIVGQSGMFFGHFKHYAHAIRNGIRAAFNHVNKTGGIHGKRLRLVSMEDYGNPATAKKNVEYLLNSHHVTYFIGNMGTRSLLNLLPLIEHKAIALLFSWGGHEKLKNPALETVINGPGLLEPQVKALVDYAGSNLKISKVGIFHADDEFSQQTAQQLVTYLNQKNITPLVQTEYNRFTMDVVPAARRLIKADPKIVFCIGTSIPTVKLINHFFYKGHFGTIFLGVDSTEFAGHILKPKGVKFYNSSAVPDPMSNFMIAQDYRKHTEELLHEKIFNTLSFTYYLGTKIFIQALKLVKYPSAPQDLVKKIEAMKNFDLGGITVSFNKENRHIFGETAYIIHNQM